MGTSTMRTVQQVETTFFGLLVGAAMAKHYESRLGDIARDASRERYYALQDAYCTLFDQDPEYVHEGVDAAVQERIEIALGG